MFSKRKKSAARGGPQASRVRLRLCRTCLTAIMATTSVVVAAQRPWREEVTTRWTSRLLSRCIGYGLCCWAARMCTLVGWRVARVGLLSGEGIGLEVLRSLGSGHTRNERKGEREKESRVEGVMARTSE